MLQYFYKKGFTLIETLLVIAILSILVAVSLTAYQKQNENTKVTKAALEIQSILQAATVYFNTTGNWPAANGSTDQIPSDFIPYLPINSTQTTLLNPWGYTYFINGNLSSTQFSITTQVPPALASRLSALLPFGTATTNSVSTLLSTPQHYQDSVIISTLDRTRPDITNLNSPDDVLINCPTGWSAEIVYALNHIHADEASKGIDIGNNAIRTIDPNVVGAPQNAAGEPNLYCQPSTWSSASLQWKCHMQVQADTRTGYTAKVDNLGNMTFTYISFCVPNSSMQKTINSFSNGQ